MLTTEHSTGLCKSVEIFPHLYVSLDLPTLFHMRPVEKPVENVENSCGILVSVDEICGLCRLIFSEAGFFHKDNCFFVNTLKTILLFVKNIEKTPLLLGILMVLSWSWLWPDDIFMPFAQLREKAV